MTFAATVFWERKGNNMGFTYNTGWWSHTWQFALYFPEMQAILAAHPAPHSSFVPMSTSCSRHILLMRARIHAGRAGDQEPNLQRYFCFNVYALVDGLSCLVKGILLGAMWDHMHTYRKTQALYTPNAYHRLNIFLQMPIRKTSYSHRGGKKHICGLQERCTWHVPLFILIIEIPQVDVKHFQGVLLKNFQWWKKGRTPPQQIILSCLFYNFHCFPTFRVTKKEKARREEEFPFGQHLFPSAGKELNGIGMMVVIGGVGSSVSYLLSPSTYRPCFSKQAFSHLKVTVHDPTGTSAANCPYSAWETAEIPAEDSPNKVRLRK